MMNRPAAAEPRRSGRLRLKRARDASPPSRRSVSAADLKLATDVETLGVKPVVESDTEEGSAYDAGADFTGFDQLFWSPDERISRWRRLYKKRANMSLVFYHKNNPDRYKFAHVRLNDVFDFFEGEHAYLHMNFRAKNVATESEELFFAELIGIGINDDHSNGYYRVGTCDIVDGNCASGMKQKVDGKVILEDKIDIENCYVCAEKIKHPVGSTYKGGHSYSDYGVRLRSLE